jgi:hypothetical protein
MLAQRSSRHSYGLRSRASLLPITRLVRATLAGSRAPMRFAKTKPISKLPRALGTHISARNNVATRHVSMHAIASAPARGTTSRASDSQQRRRSAWRDRNNVQHATALDEVPGVGYSPSHRQPARHLRIPRPVVHRRHRSYLQQLDLGRDDAAASVSPLTEMTE